MVELFAEFNMDIRIKASFVHEISGKGSYLSNSTRIVKYNLIACGRIFVLDHAWWMVRPGISSSKGRWIIRRGEIV